MVKDTNSIICCEIATRQHNLLCLPIWYIHGYMPSSSTCDTLADHCSPQWLADVLQVFIQ